jgi:hypothetical protein
MSLREVLAGRMTEPVYYDLALARLQRNIGDARLFAGLKLIREVSEPESDLAEEEVYARLKDLEVIDGDRTSIETVRIVSLLSFGYRSNPEAWDDRIARYDRLMRVPELKVGE